MSRLEIFLVCTQFEYRIFFLRTPYNISINDIVFEILAMHNGIGIEQKSIYRKSNKALVSPVGFPHQPTRMYLVFLKCDIVKILHKENGENLLFRMCFCTFFLLENWILNVFGSSGTVWNNSYTNVDIVNTLYYSVQKILGCVFAPYNYDSLLCFKLIHLLTWNWN